MTRTTALVLLLLTYPLEAAMYVLARFGGRCLP